MVPRKVQAEWASRVGSAVVEWGRWSTVQREELGGVGEVGWAQLMNI